jgi:hypothetical protein
MFNNNYYSICFVVGFHSLNVHWLILRYGLIYIYIFAFPWLIWYSKDTGFVSEVFISFVREGGKAYTIEPLDPDTGIFIYIHHVMVLSDQYIFYILLPNRVRVKLFPFDLFFCRNRSCCWMQQLIKLVCQNLENIPLPLENIPLPSSQCFVTHMVY